MRTIVIFAMTLSFSALMVGCNKTDTEAMPAATCTERPDKIPVQTAKAFCLTKYKDVDMACQRDPIYQYLQREAICQTPDVGATVEECCHKAAHRYLFATDQLRFDPAEHLRKYKENELKKKAASE